MSDYTKGPWTLDRDYKTAVQAGTKHVAMVNYYNSPDAETRVSDAEHEANSRLIAAAPDILEALELLHKHLFGPTPDMPRHEIDDLCRSAISKATKS